MHSTKSAGANVCATTLLELAQLMERWANNSELERVEKQLDALEAEFERMKKALAAM